MAHAADHIGRALVGMADLLTSQLAGVLISAMVSWMGGQ